MRRAWVALALLAGCLAAPSPSSSGIHGVAMLGPVCPVQRDPPDPQCADRPFVGNLSVMSVDGARVVATFATRADGSFNVTLPPGDYAIRNADNPSGLPRCVAEGGTFAVRADAWALVNVSCDTGIR